uniref:ABC transporter domain-containing protein n=1 Tax=Hemiselmis andersenii TaxID=464988 RepID=A0A6U4NJT0_HEMAN|mmetsp:Transcript_12183/g.28488  ORF Transcript_12183/g.28488 Transcript_12183/m.28488 type:complete len:382 (-) Transcript_12183:210-1355(-)
MDNSVGLAQVKSVLPHEMTEEKVYKETSEEAVVHVQDFDFRFDPSMPWVLRDIEFQCRKGSRTLLLGANGAGKSSLLRVIAGKHFHHPDRVRVFGRPAFHDTSLSLEVAHLGDRWGYENHGDITVTELLKGVEGKDEARCQKLIDVLEVDVNWCICRISDGQRRRVQLLLGLARPSMLLLLDEVTTDLDVIGRQNLLQFLVEESEVRGVTVIYATHIFDGLEKWASDLVYVKGGTCLVNQQIKDIEELNALRAKKVPAPLFRLAERWLRVEFEEKAEERRLKREREHQMEIDDPNHASEILGRERTQFTGFSRGSVIPTPNLNAAPDGLSKTQAQQEREQWQLSNNARATVMESGSFVPAEPKKQYATRTGFNKTNPIGKY